MNNRLQISTKSQNFNIEEKNGHYSLNGIPQTFDCIKISNKLYHIIYQHQSFSAELVSADFAQKTFKFLIDGQEIEMKAQNSMDMLLEKMGISAVEDQKGGRVEAPMPGKILEISCEVGKEVEKGDKLLVLEAMKMENIIKSPVTGTIKKISVEVGENVEKKHLLIELD